MSFNWKKPLAFLICAILFHFMFWVYDGRTPSLLGALFLAAVALNMGSPSSKVNHDKTKNVKPQ